MVGNEEYSEKINDSFSGNAIANFGIFSAQLILLGVNRIWDNDGRRVCGAIESIAENVPRIEIARRAAHPDWEDDWLQISSFGKAVSETMELSQKLLASKEFAEARVLRTEFLAHSLPENSRDRKKFNLVGVKVAPSLDTVDKIAKDTIEVVDRIISHWEFHIENSMQSVKLQEGYTRLFWNSVPKLADSENYSFLDDFFWQVRCTFVRVVSRLTTTP
ncbi:MAG: hypothetical protein AAF718_14275 [Pseudomonadota bacterium]